MKRIHSFALTTLVLSSFVLRASADSLDRAGSLLVFPLFDNSRNGLFTLTVTNTNPNTTPLPAGQLLAGTVDVEFVYINGFDCLEFNRTRRLTPNDTITVTTLLDNPNQAGGYCYVFAKSPTSGKAIAFDWLAGDSFHIAPGISGGADIPPIVFQAGFGIPEGGITDLDNDGVREFNGGEYDEVSDELIVPRFISFESGISIPQLILIGMTGQSFQTIVNFLVYNDNEEVFSVQYAFDCWDRVKISAISGLFTNSFLQTTNHNPLEFLRFIPAAAPAVIPVTPIETGWFRMDGATAFSTAASVTDPAFLAVRLELIDSGSATGASLPYGVGEQTNAKLVNHGPFPNAN
ncbi:MAG: hypothetical protein SGI72_01310 [Planctomycetota bacterium]|nr:hypothetical protein [Planctomycetota bacterium]